MQFASSAESVVDQLNQLNTVTQEEIFDEPLFSNPDHDATISGSINDNNGIVGVNQNAGNMNNQTNAVAIVVGEGRKFLGALIQIDFDTVGRWAAERNLQYTTFKSLAQLPQTRALVQEVVDQVNARFARVENIRRFVLLEKELDHDDGELTATQKVRRGLIDRKFARELDLIYGEPAAPPEETVRSRGRVTQ